RCNSSLPRVANDLQDFRIQDGNPRSVTDRPNNPAVLITIRGRGVPATETASNPHGAGTEFNATGGPPAMPASGADALNHLTFFVADDGAITYELAPRRKENPPGRSIRAKRPRTGWPVGRPLFVKGWLTPG